MSAPGYSFLHGEQPLSAALHGQKAALLQASARHGEQVPQGFSIDAQQLLTLTGGDASALATLGGALRELAARNAEETRVAVRSSPAQSLPGALSTELDVACNVEAVLAAARRVLASSNLPAVREQCAARGITLSDQPWLAVLVQHYIAPRTEADLGIVVFTHDPQSGERRVAGEFAQGGVQGVVSGRTRPRTLEQLAQSAPRAHTAVVELATRLADSFDEPLELELAFANDTLWLLQARPLGLSPRALVRVALDAIDQDSPRYTRWLRELAERGLSAFSESHFPAGFQPPEARLRGVPASMGVASGVVVTDVERACIRAQQEPVILVRPDAVPEDIAGFRAAKAVVTTSGGLTCHAAVIARGLGVPAVVGCAGARIDSNKRTVLGGRDGAQLLWREGDYVTVDARKGMLYDGRLPIEQRIADADLRKLFAEVRKLRPTPLWAHGDAELGLRTKEDASLDGVLCPWPAHGVPPPGRGRECWLEIDAARVSELLPQLPPGWGVVVSGDLSKVRLPELRRSAPLRAFGVRIDDAQQLAHAPRERLDLLILGPAANGLLDKQIDDSVALEQIDVARVLKVVTFSAELPVLPGHNVGWVCPVTQAALTALRYACVRGPASQPPTGSDSCPT